MEDRQGKEQGWPSLVDITPKEVYSLPKGETPPFPASVAGFEKWLSLKLN